jgi:gluconate kinase
VRLPGIDTQLDRGVTKVSTDCNDGIGTAQRVGNRRGHFMPASLVDSQFAILEVPDADERALTLDATRRVSDVATNAIGLLGGS